MKLEFSHEKVESNVALESIKIGIDQSESTIYYFVDFLSRLYSNPKQTLLTEYVSNAIDSMKLAGKADVPIDIHLPTKFNPHYIVRDYGVGMDHNEVKNIFAVALKSTKRESNELTGGYGVGKLVFSPYCGVMFLTTWKHGEKTIYQCRLKGGDGEITPIHREKSDEPQGVEIKIPVPESDFVYFQKTAKYIYAFLKTKPNIKGMQFDTEFELQTDKFSILRDKFEQTSFASVITIGDLPFEVSPSRLQVNYQLDNLLRYSSIVLHFNVGEIDHTPSRDALEYNTKTITAIKERIEYVKTYLTDYVNEQINKCSSMHEARLLKYNIQMGETELSRVISRFNINSKFTYNNQNVTLDFDLEEKDIASIVWRSKIGRGDKLMNDRCVLQFHPSNKYIVIPRDFSELKISRRIKKYIKDNSLENIVRIHLEEGKSIQDLVDITGIPKEHFINIEDLSDPVKVYSGGRSSYSRTTLGGKIFEFNNYTPTHKITVHNWDESDFDYENDSGVYVFVKYNKPENVEESWEFIRMLEGIKVLNPDFTLFGVKTTEKNKVGKNMIHLNDYLKSLLGELKEELQDLPIKQSVELIRRIRIDTMPLGKGCADNCDVISYVNNYLKRVETRKSSLANTILKTKEVYNMIADFLGEQPYKEGKTIEHKNVKRLKKAVRVIENKYPLYHYMSRCVDDTDIKEYVQALNFYKKHLTKQARSRILSV